MKMDNGQKLQFSCEKIELYPKANRAEGSFQISSREGEGLKGCLLCNDPRISIYPERFQGEEIEVQVFFEGRENICLEKIEGELICISNKGEALLPFEIRPPRPALESSLGEIRNLFHFTNLARGNWEEAVNLFFRPEFEGILETSREEERELYRGLYSPGKEQCVEEFLQNIRKKTPVVYRLKQDVLKLRNLETDQKEEISILREGWGYTNLYLRKEGEFFHLEKEILRESDFLGNSCELAVYIDVQKLHQGKNHGVIFLDHAYGSIMISVEVEQNHHHRMRPAIEKRRSLKKMRAQLIELYVDFRAKRMSSSRWRRETLPILERMRLMDERDPLPKLFTAHLQISTGKVLEGRWSLEKAARLIREDKEPVAYAYYLYLTTLPEERENRQWEVRGRVEALWRENEKSWEIAWLMLHLSANLHGSNEATMQKWEFLRTVFQAGCTSPVLYTEAVMLLNLQPTLLMELGALELRILRFAQSRSLLSEELMGVIQYLAMREKGYSHALFKLLESICLTEDRTDMLQALCSLLIKGDKRETKYFPWYEWAVSEGLKITRLYEYYLLSLDRDKEVEIPRMVLLYFSYETSLSYPNTAYLYRYVYENRENMEELYWEYIPRIERFVLKQLYRGEINKDLGYLYEHLLVPHMLTADNAEALEQVMFLHSFASKLPEDECLIIVHKHLSKITEERLVRGRAYPKLMGRNCMLFRENKRGERFFIREEDRPEPFFHLSRLEEGLVKRLSACLGESIGLSLYFCEEMGGWQPIREENQGFFAYLSENEEIQEEVRQELRGHLIDYYREEGKLIRLENWLETCRLDALGKNKTGSLIDQLLSVGFYEKACNFVLEHGPQGINPKALVRMGTYMLEEDLGEEKERVWLIYTAFHEGKYNSSMLRYLAQYFHGSSEQMMKLFLAAKEFEVEVYELSERLLAQMLFSGTKVEGDSQVFREYVAQGAKSSLESAFLVWCARGYLAEIRELDDYFIRDMLRVYGREHSLPPACRLACLKYFSVYPKACKEEEKEIMELFLWEAVRKREWHFPFLKNYEGWSQMEVLCDKTTLFCRRQKGEEVVVHYRKKGEEEFCSGKMKELYGGLFSKEWVLFEGEEMEYYLTAEQNNQQCLFQSGKITKEAEDKGGEGENSRYGRISRIQQAFARQQYEEAGQLLRAYQRMDGLVRRVFR